MLCHHLLIGKATLAMVLIIFERVYQEYLKIFLAIEFNCGTNISPSTKCSSRVDRKEHLTPLFLEKRILESVASEEWLSSSAKRTGSVSRSLPCAAAPIRGRTP
jgi:hypothetical protein